MKKGMRNNKTVPAATAVFLAFLLFLTASGCDRLKDKYWTGIRKGNSSYSIKKYDDALKNYNDAKLAKPESTVAMNNIGNVFYKKNDFDKAKENYQKALKTNDKAALSKAHYNLGNAHYRKDELEDAIKEYKDSLDLDPNDIDAKFNLEFARVKLKEKIEKQKNQQNKQNKQDEKEKHRIPDEEKKQENKNCPNPKQSPGAGKEGEKKEQQQQAGGGEKKEQSAGQKGAGQKKPGEMSKEEAAAILQALDNREKDDKKQNMMPIPAGSYRPEKDW